MVLRCFTLLLLSPILLVTGCSSERDMSEEALDAMAGEGGRKETVAISGKVTIDGSPTGKVNIYAYTQASGMEPAGQVSTSEDGTYCWATYTNCDGLPPETYRLAFKHIPKQGKADKDGEDLLGGKYANPMKNDFELVVEAGKPQENIDYDLTN